MSVPSFTSFPQLEAEPSRPQSPSYESQIKSERRKHGKSGSSSKRRDHERRRDLSKERRRDKDRHNRREKEKHRDKDGNRREDERRGRADDTVDESYRLFFSDRRPDHLNVQYGGLHAGDIPKYRMKAGGRYAIGLSRGLVLHRVGKGVEVCLQTRANKVRSFVPSSYPYLLITGQLSGITDSRTRSLLSLPPNRRIVHSEDSHKYAEIDGFIKIASRRAKPQPEDTYRSIIEARDGDSSDPESNSSGASSDEDSDDQGNQHPETSQQAQIKALEQQLALDKGSVSTWLSLLEVTLSSIPITSKNATRARSDISVSLLERAIGSHPTIKASASLRIKYLKAGEEIWNEKQLGEKWEEALDPYRQWASREAAVDRMSLFPTRAASTEEDGDPYSMILFPDIRAPLVKVTTPQAKHALRLATLSFIGLPIPGLSQVFSPEEPQNNWDDRWCMKAFLDTRHLALLFPDVSQGTGRIGESIAGAIIAQEKEYRDSFGPIRHWGFQSLAPLDTLSVDVKLTLRTFSQLRQADSDVEWDLLALLFEEVVNVKSALKLSKAFLSVPREASILEYWSAHAQLERMNGRLDGARKVYHTVLVGSSVKHSSGGMWWNWAEMEWLAGNEDQAMNVVLSSVGIDSSSGVSILRAKRTLDELISSPAQWRNQEGWVKLRALLELLHGASMDEVLRIFDDQLSVMGEGSFCHESLTVASLMLVYNHRVILNKPMPPILLRNRAAQGLEIYPSNSMILGIFLEGEKGQGVWGKVRSMLGASDGKAKDVARRMEEVWVASWEKGRWMGELERTRNGLAAAVEHERTRASAVIWRLYLEFEIRAGRLQDAKRLLFRAIKECPLDKELYLLAFGPLRSVFDGKELQDLADLMVERGVRLRKGLGEGMHLNREELDNEEDTGDEDEIEHNARELRRLMPY
ncbi:hypothetical protein MD484_g1134, partial [Candolleomyces efflorescens]